MGKGKPRHNPDKPQNKRGGFCTYYDGTGRYCEAIRDTTKCQGNPHSCVKVAYQIIASKSDKQKNDGNWISSRKY